MPITPVSHPVTRPATAPADVLADARAWLTDQGHPATGTDRVVISRVALTYSGGWDAFLADRESAPAPAPAPAPALLVCDLCARVQSPGVDCCTPDDASPARSTVDADRDRHDADGVRALRLFVIVAPLLIVAAVAASALGWVDAVNVALSGAPAAPVAAAVSPVAGPVAPCGGDADCAAWEQAQTGAVGASGDQDGPGWWDCSTMGNRECGPGSDGGPVLVPASDGGTGFVCAPGGEPVENEAGVVVCAYGALLDA